MWLDEVRTLDPAQVVVLDETSTSTRLTPLRGRSPRGQRVHGIIPQGRWESITLIATMSLSGMGPALQVPGALDRDAFDAFVEGWLVPTLHAGQIVSWDNLSVHKSQHAHALIEAAGCRILPTPRYSPDCNPIEQSFAKLKSVLRRAAPRTFAEVVTATGMAMATITARDAQNFFADAGYRVKSQPL